MSLTASFADYPFLSAAEVPSFELADMETPTSYNPLGAKGIGEAGTLGSTPAVQDAVIDALAPLGVRHIHARVSAAGLAGPASVIQYRLASTGLEPVRAAAAEEGRLPEPSAADLGCCNERTRGRGF